jgi:Zinc carboxypeptidase
MVRRIFLVVAILSSAIGSVSGQSRIKSPEEFLGYSLGDRFTPHARVVDYFQQVAASSEGVVIVPYGTTNEGRTLEIAIVSSPANTSRLEQIRMDNLKLASLEEGAVTGDPVAVVWLSYNVHGNESVSTEAAMATLYALADTDNDRTQAWLRNTVVILDPAINPDGRDRYVNWYNRMVGSQRNVNPDAIEHHEKWPGGRGNHFYFDLNRDWAWQTQVETRQRLPLYQAWMPQVHVDFHEQGVNEPYYFAPAAEPFHRVITDWQREFQKIIGTNHARYFDREGWLYFTRQVFDLFYPGYGDTFPIYNGAIGMTYEQGGSGRAGLGVLTAEGDTLSLADRIAHHFTTGLSTVEMVSTHHDRVLSEFGKFFADSRSSPSGPYKTWVVKSGGGTGKPAALREHLERLGIESGSVKESVRTDGYSYRTGKEEKFSVSPGDLVISAYQPRSTLLRVLFEPEPELVDSVTYDITAWALPYVYDVDAYALAGRIEPDANFTRVVGGISSGSTDSRPYAYLAKWTDRSSASFLAALLRDKIRVRVAGKSFTVDGVRYDQGTLIITRRGNEKFGHGLGNRIDNLARKYGVSLATARSGLVDSGIDFGSSDVYYVKPPKILVFTGDPLSSSSFGEVWHYFDQQIDYPITVASMDYAGSIDLDDYTVLILPSGSYDRVFSKEKLETLKKWIRDGGKLITLRGASSWFSGKDGFALKLKKEDKKEKKEKDEEPETPQKDLLKVYGDRQRARLTKAVSGAVYRVRVDNTHPLGFGFSQESFELKLSSGSPSYLDGKGVWNVGVLEEADPVSGQVGYEAEKKIGESLAFGVQDMGRGSVVFLTDDPLFRGFWYSGQLLFSNAVFFVGQR